MSTNVSVHDKVQNIFKLFAQLKEKEIEIRDKKIHIESTKKLYSDLFKDATQAQKEYKYRLESIIKSLEVPLNTLESLASSSYAEVYDAPSVISLGRSLKETLKDTLVEVKEDLYDQEGTATLGKLAEELVGLQDERDKSAQSLYLYFWNMTPELSNIRSFGIDGDFRLTPSVLNKLIIPYMPRGHDESELLIGKVLEIGGVVSGFIEDAAVDIVLATKSPGLGSLNRESFEVDISHFDMSEVTHSASIPSRKNDCVEVTGSTKINFSGNVMIYPDTNEGVYDCDTTQFEILSSQYAKIDYDVIVDFEATFELDKSVRYVDISFTRGKDDISIPIFNIQGDDLTPTEIVKLIDKITEDFGRIDFQELIWQHIESDEQEEILKEEVKSYVETIDIEYSVN